MLSQSELVQKLSGLEGKRYPAYKALKGQYQYQNYEVWIDHVQGDPFAEPSKVRIKISLDTAGFPEELYSKECRITALCDFLAWIKTRVKFLILLR